MISRAVAFERTFPGVPMRRFFSITTILALMSSLASPLLAAVCDHSGQPMACHRATKQRSHCEMMAGHNHHSAASESAEPAVAGREVSGNCPMDCCISGHPTSASTIAATPSLPPLVVIEHATHVAPVVFTRTGFSSHTDRGPPAA
jgi:hypothetical protein